MGVEILIVVFLVVLGIALILAEIFLLPGLTVAGIAGALSLVGGVIYAFMYIGNTAGFITIGSSAVIGVGAFVYLVKSNAMNRIALETDIDATVDRSDLNSLSEGDRGKAISRLNPIGKVEFGETIVEAKSFDGEFVDDGEFVEIVKVDSMNVMVRKVNL